MGAYLLDWLNLLLRLAHVAFGIVWVGASFYFFWLEHEPQARPADPRSLRWEAYWTWITGFALLAAIYYLDAPLYLIDPAVMPLSQAAAIGIGLAFLVAGLVAYEGICRSPLSRNEPLLYAVLLGFLALTAWGLARIFSGRGAFIHYGAVLGTIMAGNLAHVAIPVERRRQEALREGRAPDARDAAIARQRSLHNAYLVLPVVFAMVGNHYAAFSGHRHAWLMLPGMTFAGALLGAWLVARRKGGSPWWPLAAAIACLSALAYLFAPVQKTAGGTVSLAAVKGIMASRCASCHARRPAFQGLAQAPKGVTLESEDDLRKFARHIHQQTVMSRSMPPGNLTEMTEEERSQVDAWFRALPR